MEKQATLPTILLPGFDNSEASFSVASALREKGYPILAVCAPGDAAALEAARSAGFEAIEAERDDALRAGLALCRDRAGLPGVIWLESGLGYTAADTLAVAHVAAVNPDAAVIASRAKCPDTGVIVGALRTAARLAFVICHQRDVRDAWSGLLYLPSSPIEGYLGEKGRGDAYRLRLLLTMQRRGVRVIDIPVSAPYGRDRSAKSMLLDIFKIALVPLMFIASSVTLTGADYTLSFLLYYVLLPGNKPVSVFAGRVTGALVGYLINRKAVFRQPVGYRLGETTALMKYAMLVALNSCIALLLVSFLVDILHLEYALTQVIVGLALYAPNYLLQRDFVFGRGSGVAWMRAKPACQRLGMVRRPIRHRGC